MTGSVQHITGDRYRVIMYVPKGRHGNARQRSRSFRATSDREAERVADRIRAELRDEIEQGRAVRGTIAELVETWLADCELTKSATTMKGYRICARRIVGEFGAMKVDELTPQDVRAWYTRLAKGDPKRGVKPMTPALVAE